MKIKIENEKRKSIAFYLAPEELTIALPDNVPTLALDSLRAIVENPRLAFGPRDQIGKEEFKAMVTTWMIKLDVRPSRIQLRNLTSKWASCSPSGNIIFNQKLLNMPKQFAEYVICHELLHLKVKRHNKLFRNLLYAYMPDWRERLTATIKEILGNSLEILSQSLE